MSYYTYKALQSLNTLYFHSASMATITLEDLFVFHSIDREIFTRLVINLTRDPAQSLLVTAMWLWLEETKFPKIASKILNVPDTMLNVLANEAVSCLTMLESRTLPVGRNGGILPVTTRTIGKNISLFMFYKNKFSTISGIKLFLNNVCAIIFSDILQRVLPSQNTDISNLGLVIPGFPNPIFGGISVIPKPLDYTYPVDGLWGWSLNIVVPEDDRTMFLTFSKGYPVTEGEIVELFKGYFGDCVESIQMGGTYSGDQPLYAKMVVRDVSTVDQILDGDYIAKFGIKGKHVWARKYERRDTPERVY